MIEKIFFENNLLKLPDVPEKFYTNWGICSQAGNKRVLRNQNCSQN